jgi:RimJ/RimL family protein N-acetyltransferase
VGSTLSVRLAPFARPHFESLIAWSRSAEQLFAWAGPSFSFPLDSAQLSRHVRESPAANRLPFTACDPDGKPVGHLELADVDREQRSAYVVRGVVDPELRRMGVGTAMMRAVLRVAFDELALHRVEARVFATSKAALSAWEGCGFVREGALRDARLLGGSFQDLVVMGILDHEWRAAKGRM